MSATKDDVRYVARAIISLVPLLAAIAAVKEKAPLWVPAVFVGMGLVISPPRK